MPDQPPFQNPGSGNVSNVFPIARGYKPFQSLNQISTTGLNGQVCGAFSSTSDAGTTYFFAGTATKLYLFSGGTWSDVSVGGGYSLAAGVQWSFTQFGHRIIAVATGQAPQYYDMDVSSLFANLAGSPPTASFTATLRDFVFLANTGTAPNQVVWSGFENSTDWSILNNNQSATQTLYNYGPITGMVGGDVIYVFQRYAITRITYVGSPLIFQFDTMEVNRGLGISGSLVKIGQTCYFWDGGGFYEFDGSGPSRPIGHEKFDAWFAANKNNASDQYVSASFDPVNNLVCWGFVSANAVNNTQPDTILCYNYILKRAVPISVTHDFIYGGLTAGYTMETLASTYPNLDTLPASLDSPQWQGGVFGLFAFDSTHFLCSFTGSNLAATIETTEFEAEMPTGGMRGYINNARPLSDTSSAAVTIKARERLADTLTTNTAGVMQANGDTPLISSGRYQRAVISIPASTTWTYAQGVDVSMIPDGVM